MKKKKVIVFLTTIVALISLCVFTASAAQPRWTNVNRITRHVDPSTDSYRVIVSAVDGTSQIKISAQLLEKNSAGNYIQVHSTTRTYYSIAATLVGSYDMSTNKEYKVMTTVEVTSNGYTEVINLS